MEKLAYSVRLMRRGDISQITEIDREIFPSLWPPANYRRELENRFAHYIVACEEGKIVDELGVIDVAQGGLSRLVCRLRHLFIPDHFSKVEPSLSDGQYILGFAGLWMMAGEAHIISLAVREIYRRQGIGELLLISTIDLSAALKTSILTLEVRNSNIAAQSLYRKYGFNQVGLRKGYYIDNREDGVIMSTETVSSDSFQARLDRLKQAHSSKWGIVSNRISR